MENARFCDEEVAYIFSNYRRKSQFHAHDNLYIFDPQKGKSPGSFRYIYAIQDRGILFLSPSVFLHYDSEDTDEPNVREFELRLFHDGKVVKDRGLILKKGDNRDYENKINRMRKKAAELLSE
jgi:hypothetical protein